MNPNISGVRNALLVRLFFLLVLAPTSLLAFAEGTPQVMPQSTSPGVGMEVTNRAAQKLGPFYDPTTPAPKQNRLYARIGAGEKLHFGVNPYFRVDILYDQPGSQAAPQIDGTTQTNNGSPWQQQGQDLVTTNILVYYRIMLDDGTPGGSFQSGGVIDPANPIGYIPDYTSAAAGPNAGGGADPSGYTPVTYDPNVASGYQDYFVEFYESSDGGVTPRANFDILFIYFDFTVANATERKPGRIFSQGFSLCTYSKAATSPSNFPAFHGDPSVDMGADYPGFFLYTDDGTISLITLNPGFRPLSFVLACNSYGVDKTKAFEIGRRSISLGADLPNLGDGYRVFLLEPEDIVFPRLPEPTPPTISGITPSASPCGYNIAVSVPASTDPSLQSTVDIGILLDLDGSDASGNIEVGTPDGELTQNSRDKFLFKYGVTPGTTVNIFWDGFDNKGNDVTGGAAFPAGTISFQTVTYYFSGRTNVPFVDVETSKQGFRVEGWWPTPTYVPRLFWDDAHLGNKLVYNNPTPPATPVVIGGDKYNDPNVTCDLTNANTYNNNILGEGAPGAGGQTISGADVSVNGVSQLTQPWDPFSGVWGNRWWDGEWTEDADPEYPDNTTLNGNAKAPTFVSGYNLVSGNDSRMRLCDDFGNNRILNTWFWNNGITAGGDKPAIAARSCTLPVKFLSFSGRRLSERAELTWTTAEEVNLNRYEIQRSFNGREFTTLGSARPQRALRNTYHYNDAIGAFAGKRIYYRIRSVDEDGSSRYSRVVTLSPESAVTGLRIEQLVNPVTNGSAQFQIVSTESGTAEIRIIDGTGNLVRRSQRALRNGANATTLDLSGLGSGLYVIEVLLNENRESAKILITK